MVQEAPSIPTPAEQSVCRSCGEPIGWVVLPGHHFRPINLRPHPMGEYALLPGGIRALSLHDAPRLPPDEAAKVHDEIRYFDHVRTCISPSMRTCLAAIGNCLGWLEAKYDGDDERVARFEGHPQREARRRRMLEEERWRRASDVDEASDE
jgi:hypothetical protein